MKNEIKQAKIDEDVQETMLIEQIDLGTENEKQINRVELNFFAELLSQFRELNKNMENLYQTLNMVGADKLTAYFKEFSDNFKQEEAKEKLQKKLRQSHKTAKSKLMS